MATTSDFRNGLCLEFNNDLFTIVQFQHVKPGKGPAFVRTKMKSLTTGKVIENTFTAGVKVNTARVERRPYQFLYSDDMADACVYLLENTSFKDLLDINNVEGDIKNNHINVVLFIKSN